MLGRVIYWAYTGWRGRGPKEVIMERPIWFNGRVIVESVGVLGWENDRYVWQLPEEAYTATSLTAAEVADILGLLNWLNSNEV